MSSNVSFINCVVAKVSADEATGCAIASKVIVESVPLPTGKLIHAPVPFGTTRTPTSTFKERRRSSPKEYVKNAL
jgi:hypothetical protein